MINMNYFEFGKELDNDWNVLDKIDISNSEFVFDRIIRIYITFNDGINNYDIIKLLNVNDFDFYNDKIKLTTCVFNADLYKKYTKNSKVKKIKVIGKCVNINNPSEIIYYNLNIAKDLRIDYISFGLNTDSEMKVYFI